MIDYSKVPKISWSVVSTYGAFEEATRLGEKMSDLGVSYLHYDISSHSKTMLADDIPKYRDTIPLPIDVHIATEDPIETVETVMPHLRDGDFLAVHIEDEKTLGFSNLSKRCRARSIRSGLAINVDTPIEACLPYTTLLDYVLIMAAEPGVSGGHFARSSFEKVIDCRKLMPNVSIHVDGGVDQYSSAMLREAGVDVLISGSYLTTGVGAVEFSRLIGRNILVDIGSVMRTGKDLPLVRVDATMADLARVISKGKIGCACVEDANGKFCGLVTDGDLRRTFIQDMHPIRIEEVLNREPVVCKEPGESSYQFLREQGDVDETRSVYPVLKNGKCVGILVTRDLMFHKF